MKTPNTTQKRIRARLRDERGAGVLEYALIVSLIAVASITAVSLVGGSVAETLDEAATSLSSADTNVAANRPTAISRVDGKTRLASVGEDDTVLRLQESPSILRQAPQESSSVLPSAPSRPTTRLDSGEKLTADTGSQNQNPTGDSVLRLLR